MQNLLISSQNVFISLTTRVGPNARMLTSFGGSVILFGKHLDQLTREGWPITSTYNCILGKSDLHCPH